MAKILIAKYIPGEPLGLTCVDTRFEGRRLTELREDGCLDFIPAEQPMPEPGKNMVEILKVIDGKIIQSWSIQDEIPKQEDGMIVVKWREYNYGIHYIPSSKENE